MINPANLRYTPHSLQSIAAPSDYAEFARFEFSRFTLAPEGGVAMPRTVVENPPSIEQVTLGGSRFADGGLLRWSARPDQIFPPSISHPALHVARLAEVWCLPFSPPFVPRSRQILTEFLVPWSPEQAGWFKLDPDGHYFTATDVGLENVLEVETAFYMGHLIAGHFGHFLADIFTRIHAWSFCKQLFPDLKLIIEDVDEDSSYRAPLLRSAGVAESDIVPFRGPVRCGRLLAATCSLSVSRWASSTSAELWRTVRGGFVGSTDFPGRIYISRAGQKVRRLLNEDMIEAIFHSVGFAIVQPEKLPIGQQVALFRDATLIAGSAGSGLFNLAFCERVRSVFMLTSERFVNPTEMLFLAGMNCSATVYLGRCETPTGAIPSSWDPWRIDEADLRRALTMWLNAAQGDK